MPGDAYNVKYLSKINTREYNTFTEEYFAGADMTLTMNGKVLVNVASLQYTLQEQQKPIYSYASRIFNDISIGNRIVVGTIKIPISNTGVISSLDISSVKPVPVVDPVDPTWILNTTSSSATKSTNSLLYYGTDSIDATKDNVNAINTFVEPSAPSNVTISDDVKKIQAKLIILKYNVDVTGFYDTKTINAVKDYQSKNSLSDTGELNDSTKTSILGNIGSVTVTLYKTTNSLGSPVMTGPYVNSSKLVTLPVNTTVTTSEEYQDWRIVKTSTGIVGYIAKTNLEVIL